MNNIPFLLTMLVSVFAWTMNQITDELANSPIIEITSKTYEKGNNKLTYVLTNISNTTLFKNISFEIYNPEAKCVGEQDVILGPPNLKGEDTKPSECNNNHAIFYVEEFHPSSLITLETGMQFSDSDSELYIKSNNAVKLLQSDYQTYLVKNKLSILTCFFIVWLILIILFIISPIIWKCSNAKK